MFFVGEKLLDFHFLSVVLEEGGRCVKTVTQGVITMSRKISLVEFLCQKLVSFLSNSQNVKEDKQVNKNELVKEMRQRLVFVNSNNRFLAEHGVKDLQILLDDKKNKLSDKERVKIISIKESLEKALSDLIELIRILAKKEEYTKKDFGEVDVRCSLTKDLLSEVDLFVYG